MGINRTLLRIHCYKVVQKDELTYNLQRNELRQTWQMIVDGLPLESRGNGRMTSVEESIDLTSKALAKMLKPQIMQELAMTPRQGVGLIEMPKLTHKEIIERFLKD